MNVTIDVADDSGAGDSPDPERLQHWLSELDVAGIGDAPVRISLRLVDEPEAAQLNQQWRQRDYATNVLSFPAELPEAIRSRLSEELGYRPLGDLVLCPAVIAREADEQDKNLEAHWTHLVLHGALHLLGFEHADEASASVMEALEIQSLQRLGIANPYLIG